MKAWVYQLYGNPSDVLEFQEVSIPNIGDDQVLVRVKAASVNPLDWHLMTGTPRFGRLSFGLTRPKRNVPGVDVAGTVERVGKDVKRLKPGDEVFGETSGAFAEYAAVAEQDLAMKPANLSFEEAAAVPVAGLTALQGLRDWAKMQAGQKVLINGASGGVGTFAVQIARALGAGEVTGVCSTRNVEAVMELGADRVIDYTEEDFTRTGEQYDLVFDGPGNRSFRDLRRVLAPGAVYVLIGGPKGGWIQPIPVLVKMKVLAMFFDFEAANDVAKSRLDDLQVLGDWLQSGQIKSVIDCSYKLEEIPDALSYQGTFHARAKMVVTV